MKFSLLAYLLIGQKEARWKKGLAVRQGLQESRWRPGLQTLSVRTQRLGAEAHEDEKGPSSCEVFDVNSSGTSGAGRDLKRELELKNKNAGSCAVRGYSAGQQRLHLPPCSVDW